MTTRLLIVDDQEEVRRGLRAILADEPDLEVVGEAADGHEGVRLARSVAPDLVVMDVRMPVMDGVEATRRIANGGAGRPRVLVLTTFALDEYVFAALQAGASGYLLKDSTAEQIIDAVRIVAAGDGLLAPTVTRRLIEAFARRPRGPGGRAADLARLTPRETDVLRLAATGLTNAEIGQALFVSESTVKTHMTGVLGKLHLRDRVQATIFAYDVGLVRPGS